MKNNQMTPFVSGVRLGAHHNRKLQKHANAKNHKQANEKYISANTGHVSVLEKAK